MHIFSGIVWIVEVIRAIHLPLVEKANFNGVLLAKERTAHTHYALLAELQLAVFDGDVFGWANVHTTATFHALGQHFVMLAVKAPAPMLDAHKVSNGSTQKHLFKLSFFRH